MIKQEYGYPRDEPICYMCKNFNPNTPYNKIYQKHCDKDLPGYKLPIISCSEFV